MIISAGPILVGLGVDYSLHLTNRIEENRVEILKKMEDDAWASRRDGEEVIEPDPFDPEISLTANANRLENLRRLQHHQHHVVDGAGDGHH